MRRVGILLLMFVLPAALAAQSGPGGPTWVAFEEFDTGDPVNDRLPEDYFARIARERLAAGHGRDGLVGRAESFLFEAALLVPFGVSWLERFLAGPRDRSDPPS